MGGQPGKKQEEALELAKQSYMAVETLIREIRKAGTEEDPGLAEMEETAMAGHGFSTAVGRRSRLGMGEAEVLPYTCSVEPLSRVWQDWEESMSCFLHLRRRLEETSKAARTPEWHGRFGSYSYHAAVAAGRVNKFRVRSRARG